jgi:hypothetical protein
MLKRCPRRAGPVTRSTLPSPPPPRLARTGTRVAESMLDIEPTAELNQSVIRSVDDLEPDEEAEFSQMHENA